MSEQMEPGSMIAAWERLRGEMVGLVGLIGDVMEDWGAALRRWSARHAFTARERSEWDTPPTTPHADDRNEES